MSLDVAVVTPALNAEAVLGDCLRSVAGQTTSCEHVVVDGGSSDGTTRIARSFNHVSVVISEPDRGPYDAMNQGIRAATGEIIGILNADDMYFGDQVLEKVAEVFRDPAVDACYGDLVYVQEKDQEGRSSPEEGSAKRFRVVRYWKAGAFRESKMYWGWMPPHPTFFARRSVYERFGLFNLEQGSAADYELILRFLLKHHVRLAYLPEILVRMRVGGISNASLRARIQANRLDRRAWSVNRLRPLPWTLLAKPVRKIPQWWRRPPDPTLARAERPMFQELREQLVASDQI